MPSLGRNNRNPKELRSAYNANRFVNAMNIATNQSSGFLGVPSGDAEGFDKAIKSFEMVENNLEAYIPIVQRQLVDPNAVGPPNASDLFGALTSAQRILSRISLTKLPLGDIETINEYKAKMDAYVQSLTALRDEMLAYIAANPPGLVSFGVVQTDLEKLAERLSILSQTITNLVNVYNSGVSQPVKVGSGFNPDSDMYQTQDYVIAPRFR